MRSTPRWPRFRLRTLMVAVAIVGLAFGIYREGIRLRRRQAEYSARARHHAEAQKDLRKSLSIWRRKVLSVDQSPDSLTEEVPEMDEAIERLLGHPGTALNPPEIDERFEEARSRSIALTGTRRKLVAGSYRKQEERYRRLAEYHIGLWRKYADAADRPWLPVAPDPPEPE